MDGVSTPTYVRVHTDKRIVILTVRTSTQHVRNLKNLFARSLQAIQFQLPIVAPSTTSTVVLNIERVYSSRPVC